MCSILTSKYDEKYVPFSICLCVLNYLILQMNVWPCFPTSNYHLKLSFWQFLKNWTSVCHCLLVIGQPPGAGFRFRFATSAGWWYYYRRGGGDFSAAIEALRIRHRPPDPNGIIHRTRSPVIDWSIYVLMMIISGEVMGPITAWFDRREV